MKKAAIFALLMLATAGLGMAQSTTASTNPVGFVSISVPASSDYIMGAPLQQPAAFQGQIQSISGNQITVAGSPGWSASPQQWVFAAGTQNVTYYLQIDSGTSEGLFAQISANDSGSVTVTLNSGDSLSGVLSNATNAGGGDLISIIPYWTPATLFSGMPTGTQLFLLPSDTSGSAAGINLSASAIYTFNGTNWKHAATIEDNVPLPPLQGLILRNNDSNAINMAVTGAVPMTTNRLLLSTLAANTQQDIWFYFNSPVPEFIGSVFTDPSTHTTTTALTVGDQLYAFSNSGGINQSASFIVTWNGTGWLHHATDVTTTYQLTPGNAYILRKSATASPATAVWSGLQSYLTATGTP